MSMYHAVWVIMAGRGIDREVIRIRKNIEAGSREDALTRMGTWVYSVISHEYLAGDDVRSEGYVTLGAGDTTAV